MHSHITVCKLHHCIHINAKYIWISFRPHFQLDNQFIHFYLHFWLNVLFFSGHHKYDSVN